MERKRNKIQSISRWPDRRGKSELVDHLSGFALTRQQAILAKCFDCMGGNTNEDCKEPDCPLYPFAHPEKGGTPGKDLARELLKGRKSNGR